MTRQQRTQIARTLDAQTAIRLRVRAMFQSKRFTFFELRSVSEKRGDIRLQNTTNDSIQHPERKQESA